eukprot:3906471-Rhodomonas_salina.1
MPEREPASGCELKLHLLSVLQPWLDGELVPLLSCLQGLDSIARAPARPGWYTACTGIAKQVEAEGPLWAGNLRLPPGDK